MSDQEQASSQDGSWESKSDHSLPSSSSNHDDHEQDPGADRLEPDLLNFVLEHKDELNIETIKSFYRLLVTVKQNGPDRNLEQYIDSLQHARHLAEQELDLSRKEADKFKCKSRQLQDRLTNELSTFDTLRIDNLLKNTHSGYKQYVDSLILAKKTKEETIESLKETIKRLERENDNLDERLKRANKLIDEQRKALQSAKAQAKSNDFDLDRRRNLSNQGSVVFDMSSDLRLDSSHNIPPPPMVDPDDIIRLVNLPPEAHITSANSSSYNLSFMNNSIPPPPHVEVNLDEILRDMNGSNGDVLRRNPGI